MHDKFYILLTLIEPIVTAADDKVRSIYPSFLQADDSHDISCLIIIFENAAQFEIVGCCKL